MEHGPIHSYELVNECVGISAVHQMSTAIVLEGLTKCSGMRGGRWKYAQNRHLSGQSFPWGWPFRVPSKSTLRPEALLDILHLSTEPSA